MRWLTYSYEEVDTLFPDMRLLQGNPAAPWNVADYTETWAAERDGRFYLIQAYRDRRDRARFKRNPDLEICPVREFDDEAQWRQEIADLTGFTNDADGGAAFGARVKPTPPTRQAGATGPAGDPADLQSA